MKKLPIYSLAASVLFLLTSVVTGVLMILEPGMRVVDLQLRREAIQYVTLPAFTPTRAEYLSDIRPELFPARYYVDMWYNNGYFGPFDVSGLERCERGIGMFLPSDIIKGSAEDRISYMLNGEYESLSFRLGCEQQWCFGAPRQYGTYCLTLSDQDGFVLYTSGWGDWKSIASAEVSLSGVERLDITLAQKEGSRGTLCVVLADPRLS